MTPDGANLEPTGEGAVDLNDLGTPKAGAQDAWKPRTIKVKGRERVIQTEEEAVAFMQKGAAFEENSAELKEEKRRVREEYAEKMKALDPWFDLDKRAREDPLKRAQINAILNGEPIPSGPGESDDPYQQQIGQLENTVRRLANVVESRLGLVGDEIQGIRRSDSFRQQERTLRTKYGKRVTDENMDAARDFAEKHGLDLVTAFRSVTYDELPEQVRQEVFEEFNLDEASLTPRRSEIPSIEGLGPITPEKRAALYADPDQYSKVRSRFREIRQKERGLKPLPR